MRNTKWIAFLFLIICLPSTSYSCNDGLLCGCQRFLTPKDYARVQRIVQCYNEFSITHHFLPDSTSKITRKLCLSSRDSIFIIIFPMYRKCVFGEAAYVINIDGVNQWDIDRHKMHLLIMIAAKYPSPGEEWIVDKLTSALETCNVQPTNFMMLPFQDCLDEAQREIDSILEAAAAAAQKEPIYYVQQRRRICKRYITDKDFNKVELISNCMMQEGIQHEFSPDSPFAITRELCMDFKADKIYEAEVRKCVYKKVGLVIEADGSDQWDLETIRYFFIDYFNSLFTEPEVGWITIVIATTFITCPAKADDFSVFPFGVCWHKAKEMITSIFKEKNNSANNGLKSIQKRDKSLAIVLLNYFSDSEE